MPKPSAPAQNVAPYILRIKALFLLDVAQEFLDALTAACHPLADMIMLGLREARRLMEEAA
jgi:hypothetical protein